MFTQCKNWYAWLNTMPPKPDDLHVIGDVLVGNPGVLPVLLMREPQGINPTILILDLFLIQQPGMWPQVQACVSARFDRIILPENPNYQSVDIYFEVERIAFIESIELIS